MKRSSKATKRLVVGIVVMASLVQSVAGLSVAQELVGCEADYLVQTGDWLSKIAAQHYGDYSLYPAIVLATNACSAVDTSYATIADPWLIEPDWKLCIPDGDTAQSGFTVEALRNGEYQSEFTASGKAQLTDGEFREPVAPGSATETVILLTDRLAFGRLSDGQVVAAAILVADPGGSGTFYTLAAVVEQDGALVNVASTFLGDRVKIRSLALEGGEMVIDMVTQGPDDPFCCPTQRVVRKYGLQADELVQISEEIVGADESNEEGLAESAVSLEGTLWKLSSTLNDQGEEVPVLPGTEITLELQDGQLSGSAGCNNVFGPYEVLGNGLTFGLMGSTMMACVPAVSEQEMQYLAALSGVVSYQLTGDQLQMVNGDGETVLTFAVLDPLPLVGTTWRLTGYNNGHGGFASLLSDSEILVVFDADGGVSGPVGCNNYFASYEVGEGTLSVGPAGATRMMCAEPEGVMEQESGYLAALASAASYQIRGDLLEVWDADGVRMLSYTAETAGTNG